MMGDTEPERVDADAIRRYHYLLWGRNDWPEGSLVVAGWWDEGCRGMRVSHLPVPSPTELARWAAKVDESGPGRHLSVGVAPRLPGLTARRRGGNGDLAGLPALWADIDCVEGVHAEPPAGKGVLPTFEQAEGLLAGCPAEASFTVRSGGGLHAYWLLDEPVQASDPILKRWKAYWASVTSESGLWVDSSAFDAARSLRLPGTFNTKGGGRVPVVLVETGEPALYRPADLAALLPEASATGTADRRRVADDDNRPGTQMARGLPVSELLTRLLGWEKTGETSDGSVRWHVPGGSSGPDESHAESTVDDDGVERVWGYSPRAQEALGRDDQTPVTSWDLVRDVWCDRDAKSAAAVARLWAGSPAEERDDTVLDLLGECRDPAELADEVASRLRGEDRDSSPGVSVAEAFERLDGTEIQVAPNCYVVLGGPRHGVWAIELQPGTKDSGPVEVPRQLTDWVAWRSAVSAKTSILSDERSEPGYTVTIVSSKGLVKSIEMEEDDSLSPSKIQARSRMGLMIPEEKGKRANMLRNCFSALGASEMDERLVYISTGWLESDGRHVMAAPNGALGSSGVNSRVLVDDPLPVMRHIGFCDPPEGDALRYAAGAIRAMVGLVPDRPEIGVALVGALAAAPLRMSRRCSVMLVGRPGAGKSLLARCAFAWMLAVRPEADALIDLRDVTTAAISAALRWCMDLPFVADDFRRRADRFANARALEILSAVAGAGYQESSQHRSNLNGTLRRASSPKMLPILTGEDSPGEEAAVAERIVSIDIAAGEVDFASDGPVSSYLDAYTRNPGRPAVNQLYSSYISWLAGQLDMRGEWAPPQVAERALDALAAVSDSKRSAWYDRHPHTRPSEVVAPLAAGWEALRAWASDVGVSDLLPSEKFVDDALESLAVSSESQREESSPVTKIVAWIRSQIELGKMWVTPPTDSPSAAVASTVGWTRDPRFGNWVPPRLGTEIGVLSQDHQRVIIKPGSWFAAAAACPETCGLSQRQVTRFVLEHVGRAKWEKRRVSRTVSDEGGHTKVEQWIVAGASIPAEELFGAPVEEPDVHLAPVVPIGGASNPEPARGTGQEQPPADAEPAERPTRRQDKQTDPADGAPGVEQLKLTGTDPAPPRAGKPGRKAPARKPAAAPPAPAVLGLSPEEIAKLPDGRVVQIADFTGRQHPVRLSAGVHLVGGPHLGPSGREEHDYIWYSDDCEMHKEFSVPLGGSCVGVRPLDDPFVPPGAPPRFSKPPAAGQPSAAGDGGFDWEAEI